MIPQSVALYNTSNNSQEPLGLISKNAGYNNLGGKSNGYNGNSNGNSSYPSRGNNNYPHHPCSENSNYPHNGNDSYLPPRNTTTRRQLLCDHCKLTGHTAKKCYKLHGYPPGHRLYRGKRVAASVT